jgi:hypothetical protein
MNKFVRLIFIAVVGFMLTSCAAAIKSPVLGTLYTDVKAPVVATSNANSTKVGTSEATSILGIVATGDASIDAAAKSAGITKIHHVDEHSKSILGLFAKYKVYVYGE